MVLTPLSQSTTSSSEAHLQAECHLESPKKSRDIEACLAKCRRLESYEQQAAFLNFTKKREIKPKPNVFGTGNQSRNSNLFNVPSTSGNGNLFRPFQPQPVTARAPPRAITNFENNFGKGANNQPGQQNYRLKPMSMGAGNTSGLKGNLVGRSNNLPTSNNNVAKPNNFVPRGSDFFRNTGPSNFVSEELYNQEEQEETTECQEELPFINDNVDDQGNGEITDAENFQGDRNFAEGI
ncbi:hypothetical protein M0804_013797 [Polistes exclamans]|nr:hypothetical protein M0804_013797 [Polistes exclamans]